MPHPSATVLPGQFAFGAQDLAVAYDLKSVFTAGTNGAGKTIAIQVVRQALQSDENSFDQQFSLPAVTLNRTFLTGTCPSPCPQPTSAADANESAIDTEWAHAGAPGAAIDVISVGDVLASSQLLGLEYIANVLSAQVQVVTTSYGLCEQDSLPFNREGYRGVADQGTLEGQTWLAASGDTGADDCSNGLAQAVDLPAAVPEVLAVGGTSIHPIVSLGNVTGYGSEVAWNDSGCSHSLSGLGASGGGQSLVYPKSSWQTDTDANRDVPDVALNSDVWNSTSGFPENCAQFAGYWVIVGNAWGHLAGTSAAAPIWAGIVADLAQKVKSSLGLIGPDLYKLKSTAAFHQITSGNNAWNGVTGFPAGSGYNKVTGLGSPDGAQLVSLFTHTAQPTPHPTSFPTPLPNPSATPVARPTARAFIPNEATGSGGDVEVYDATVGASQGNLMQTLAGLGSPVDQAFDSTHTVYVLNRDGKIDTIETSSSPYTITHDKYQAKVSKANSIAVKGPNAYVTDWINRRVVIVPLSGSATPAPIPVGADPVDIVANPVSSTLYVGNAGGNSVSVINSATNAVVQTIATGKNPARLGVSNDGKTLISANEADGTISIFNVGVSPATLTATVFVGGEPTAVAINSSNSVAFVTNLFCPTSQTLCNPNGNTSNGSVELVLLKSSPIKVQCCIVVGQEPIAASFEPTGHYLWVVNLGSRSVTVIDGLTNALYGTFTTGSTAGEDWNTMNHFITITAK